MKKKGLMLEKLSTMELFKAKDGTGKMKSYEVTI